MAKGKPTLYTDDMPAKLIKFFSKPPYEIVKGQAVAADFPTIASFAVEIAKVHKVTLYTWAKKHPEFEQAMKMAKDYQERYLTVNGLKGTINSTFAIFTAKNCIGWRNHDEKQGEQSTDKSDHAYSEIYATWEKRQSER